MHNYYHSKVYSLMRTKRHKNTIYKNIKSVTGEKYE